MYGMFGKPKRHKACMSGDRPSGKLVSVLDSAVILAMFSAVCYVMGHAALLGTARRLGLPLSLMPTFGPETLILVGGRYLILFIALGFFLYLLWNLEEPPHVQILKAKLSPKWLLRMRSRTKQHPYAYLLLMCLAVGGIVYSVPFLLPLTPRFAGGPAIFGGRSSVEVVTLQLKEPNVSLAGRTFRYLWPQAGVVVLEDKLSGELVLIREDEIKLMILTRGHTDF